MSDISVEYVVNTENILESVSSIQSPDEPPSEEWSSLTLMPHEDNEKMVAYEKGLYSPGSGEICVKYISQSDSEVLKHFYYRYPCVQDPGIEKALLNPYPIVRFHPDGQDLYITLCKEMRQEMIEIFHKNLLEKTINLRKYSFNPNGVRAMAMALEYNIFVETLNLAENFLNDDACFHLGVMLTKNVIIRELNLEGCRIQASGLRNLMWGCTQNKTLQVLNISRNLLNDDGGIVLSDAFKKRVQITELYASYNNFSAVTALALAEGFSYNNKLSLLDLSWNGFFTTKGTLKLLNVLSESKNLETLNLSWNSIGDPKIAKSISKVICAPKFKHIDLSNNCLQGKAIESIAMELPNAKRLVTLNLSNNPMSIEDATTILVQLKIRRVKIQKLLMDNVLVDSQFMNELSNIMTLKSRQSTVITHGEIKQDHIFTEPDIRDIVLDRIEFLCKEVSPKIDIAIIVYQLIKDGVTKMESKEFGVVVKRYGVSLGKEMLEGLELIFPGPKKKKGALLNLEAIADYIKRKWPDRKIPEAPKKKKRRRK